MSSNTLLLKIVASSSLGSVVVAAIGYGTYSISSSNTKDVLKVNNNLSTVFVVGQATTIDNKITQSTKLSTTERNYTCKLSSSNKKDQSCIVQLIKSPVNNKNHINLTSLKTLNSSDDPTVEQLGTNTNYFKVILNNEVYSEITWSTTLPTIDIYSIGETENKYGSLKILLGINGENVDGKTVYSVGKIKEFKEENTLRRSVTSVTVASNSAKCLFFQDNDPKLDCSINKFGSTDNQITNFSELEFIKKDEEETGEIKKGSYYLFKLTDSSKSKSKSEFKTDAGVEITVTATNPQPTGSENVNKLDVEDLVPAILIGEDNNKSILLLGDIPRNKNN